MRILLFDTNEAMREIIPLALLGDEVLVVDDKPAAEAALCGNTFDVLITNQPDFAASRPFRTIYVSSDPVTPLPVGSLLLKKPFSREQLLAAVRNDH